MLYFKTSGYGSDRQTVARVLHKLADQLEAEDSKQELVNVLTHMDENERGALLVSEIPPTSSPKLNLVDLQLIENCLHQALHAIFHVSDSGVADIFLGGRSSGELVRVYDKIKRARRVGVKRQES